MAQNAFVLKIQRELCHPKLSRKRSGLSRNGPWGHNPLYAEATQTHVPCDLLVITALRRRTKAQKLVDLLQSLYTGTTASIKGLKSSFETQAGRRQGDVESCCCFKYYLVWCLKVAAVQIDAGWFSERIWQCVWLQNTKSLHQPNWSNTGKSHELAKEIKLE